MTQKNQSNLYQKTILTHNKSPKNFGKLDNSCCSIDGQNRMCGDYISLHLAFDKEQPSLKVIANLSFEGEGCAILKASSSMMTELLKGKNINEVSHLFKEFKKILFNEIEFSDKLGEINIFAGLAKFPSRIQCALLSWDTLIKGLEKPC